ncbi:MAG: inner membrane CreD family protein, partial [Bacteroidetes bacterium]|nr:inner membrane CreD family protein [Bacteroidota bacterium]
MLLIPTLFIQNIITERQSRHENAVREVNSRWAPQQIIKGPVVVVQKVAANG